MMTHSQYALVQRLFGSGGMALGLGLLAPAVWAQTEGKDTATFQRVEVTGSNIKRTTLEGPSPIQVITRAEIEQSGAKNAAELLDTVVANNNAGGQYRTNNTNNNVVGGSGVSLRNLGPNSTLVLLNGRRLAFYGFSDQSVFVDLNSIPFAAIERVEIVKDGASAIYGSDALAGVVNFILRKNYDGVDLRVSSARSQTYGDKDGQTATLSAGKTSGALSLMGIVDIQNAHAVQVSERKGGRQADRTAAALQAGYQNPGLYAGAGVGGMYPATSSSQGNWYSNNPANGFAEEYFSAGNCQAPNLRYTGTYNGYDATGMCLDPVTDRFNTLSPKTRRVSAYGRAHYEISPSLAAFAELSYAEIRQAYEYWPVFKNDYYDPGVTPHFPLGQVPAGWGYYSRLYDELGPKVRDVSSRSTRLVAGMKGETEGWDWEAALTQTDNRTDFLGRNYLSVPVWEQGVANGSINPFQPLTPANVAALKTTHTRRGDSAFTLLDANASGQIGQLPAGPVMLALGASLRSEKMSDGIDAASNAGLVENTAVRLPVSASRNADALYAELSVPLHKTVETQLALRRDHFSDFGSSVNPKLALKWTPAAQFALRGSYATGFRAPSLAEMYGGIRSHVDCPATSPVCPAFNQVWGRDVTVTFGNSPNLEPEKSKSANIGFIWEPVKSHSIGVDVWSIERSNQVYTPNIGNPADGAYFTQISGASNAAPAAFAATYVNLGKTRVQGVDVSLQNRWLLGPWGDLRFTFNTSRLSTYDVEFRGITTPYAGEYGYPKWRHRADLSWRMGHWTTALAGNYRGSFRQAVAGPGGVPMKLDSFTTFDLFFSYKGLARGMTISGGIRNLLGTEPPFDRLGRLGTLYEDDSDGRSIYLTLDYKF